VLAVNKKQRAVSKMKDYHVSGLAWTVFRNANPKVVPPQRTRQAPASDI